MFTLSAESKEEVDNWQKEVKKAGGKIISNAEEFGNGYYGFVFTDPDEHKFNVFCRKGHLLVNVTAKSLNLIKSFQLKILIRRLSRINLCHRIECIHLFFF